MLSPNSITGPERTDAALDRCLKTLPGECDRRFLGVPLALGVRGCFVGAFEGDLEGVVLIATSGARVSAAGGESEEEKPGEAESLGSTAGGVRGVVG